MFDNREDAGEQLAEKLLNYKNSDALILALPRGGVVVGREIATRLNLPLDVLVSRKLGSSENPEFGIGAISEAHTVFLDEETLRYLHVSAHDLENSIAEKEREVEERVKLFRHGKKLRVRGKTTILVDDGIATGVTMKAAREALRKMKPKKTVLALPVAPREVAQELEKMVDEFICLRQEDKFQAVGEWYTNFEQVTDEEVVDLLNKANVQKK